ncbi:MAG: amidohydrolase family protein [Marinobacter sp.]
MTLDIPFCEAAQANVTSPSFTLPPGSCDSHAHVFADPVHYPFTANRSYTPPPASLEAYLALHRALGIDRGVLVQPSVYGTDNRVHCDALSVLKSKGLNYRGICVVNPDVPEPELQRLDDAGFTGVRMNLLFKGGLQWRDVSQLAGRIADRGWHLQFLINVADCGDIMSRIRALPVPVVFDHMGHMPTQEGIEHPGFQALLELLQAGTSWVKLSGSYRITGATAYPYPDVAPFARALVAANPDRCLWGSDWPHPHFAGQMPNDGDLLNDLADWIPDQGTRHKVLVDNPANLYRLGPVA